MQTLIFTLFFITITPVSVAMHRSSHHSEKLSHSPKRMLNEFLRKSDNCLRELTRTGRSQESSPLRSYQSIQNLDQHALATALVLPEIPSPRENELSSSPKKFLPSLFGRSNSCKHMINPKVSKETSTPVSPRTTLAQGSDQPPDESSADEADIPEIPNDLKSFLRKKMKKEIIKIRAGKIKPAQDISIIKSYPKDPLAQHYPYALKYKNTECSLYFIACTNGKIVCFINCPLHYEIGK